MCGRYAITLPPEAMRDAFGRIVIFDDCDATTMIETDVDGRAFALAHVVRGINRRTPSDISGEIRSVQTAGMSSVSPRIGSAGRRFLALPGCLRRLFFRLLLSSPERARRHTGTILVTSVGMFGTGAGWGFSAPGIHNLSIVIGGIAKRPATDPGTDGQREILCLTVSANHQTVDGAPVARFVAELAQLVESADGLTTAR